MTPDEQEPPTHRMSRVEDRERILAEALAHAEEQEAQYRLAAVTTETVQRARWKTPLALVVLMLAGWLAVAPPGWVRGAPPPTLQVGDLERGVRAALYIQAQQIEVYRAREGRLPRELSEVPGALPGIRFVRSNNRVYQLVGRRPSGGNLIYDSARPSAGIEAVAASWFDAGDPPS